MAKEKFSGGNIDRVSLSTPETIHLQAHIQETALLREVRLKSLTYAQVAKRGEVKDDWTTPDELVTLIKDLQAGKPANFPDAIHIIANNAHTIALLSIAAKTEFVRNIITGIAIGRIQGLDDEKKKIIETEINDFLTRNNTLIGGALNALAIKKMLLDLEVILFFWGKVELKNSTLKAEGKEQVTFNEYLASVGNLYNNPGISPLLKKFFEEYSVGKLPKLKEIFEEKTAEKVSPEYQRFITDEGIRTAIRGIITNPKLGEALTRIGTKINEINATKGRKGLEVASEEIAKDLLILTGDFRNALKNFLKQNPEVWRYFIDHGFVIGKDSKTGEKSVIISVFGDGAIYGKRLSELDFEAVFDVFFTEEVIGLMLANFFTDMFKVGGIFRGFTKWGRNTKIKRAFKEEDITYHRIPFQLGTRGAPKHQHLAEVLGSFLKEIDDGNITGEAFRANLEKLKNAYQVTK